MPVKLKVDYDEIKSAYVKGVPLKELSEQYGIKFGTLRAYATRNGWQDDAAKAAQSVQRAITAQMTQGAKNHVNTVIGLLGDHLKALKRRDPGLLGLADFEIASKILDRLDQIGRRNHGLDNTEANGPRTSLVQVVVQAAPVQPVQTSPALGRHSMHLLTDNELAANDSIDVESEPLP